MSRQGRVNLVRAATWRDAMKIKLPIEEWDVIVISNWPLPHLHISKNKFSINWSKWTTEGFQMTVSKSYASRLKFQALWNVLVVLAISLAAVFSLVTQRSSPQALRDETKNGCEGDSETTMVLRVCLHSRRFCKATPFEKTNQKNLISQYTINCTKTISRLFKIWSEVIKL